MSVVKVGVGVLARHPSTGQVLLGKRTVRHGASTYSFPGGHLEYGESFVECASRELLEETNLVFEHESSVGQVSALNNIFKEEGKHYVTILMEGTISNVEDLKNMEPEKCEGWFWTSEETIRSWILSGERRLFLPIINYYQSTARVPQN